jgi:hypothetical protein
LLLAVPIPSVAVPPPAAYSGAPATPDRVRGTETVPHTAVNMKQ